jgi:pimeloyl-ACP methyl ester carboxylesterase
MSFPVRERFEVDGVELAWDRWGPDDGTPLVLCHGYSGSADDFALNIPDLARTRRVLALDHRGHGRSTKTHDEASYGLDRLAADLTTWLTTVAGRPVDLLGHSMGGRIVLQVALDHPELVRSLVLMDTSAWGFVAGGEVRDALLAFLERFDPERGLPAMVSDGAGPEQDLIDATTPDDWRNARKAQIASFDPWAFQALGRQIFSDDLPSLRDRLPELTMPVTVIAGSDDHPLVDMAPDLAAAANGELVIIDGAYHSPQLTHPDAWSAAMAGHLARADRSG